MKKYVLAWFLMLFIFSLGQSQMRGGTEYIDNYAKLMTKRAKGPQLIGSTYLYESWKPIEVKLKDGIAKLENANLNLQTSNIDVVYNNEEKEILFKDFEYAVVSENGLDREYFPGPKYKFEGKPLPGFIEILGEGDEKILVNHFNYLRKANNDAKIVGGETNDRLIKKTEIYILNNKKLTLIKKKKDLTTYYKSRSAEVEALLKDENFEIKNPFNLLSVVQIMKENQKPERENKND